MLDKLRRARTDLVTMNTLLPAAERLAHADGVDEPGSEHLLLAVTEPDRGTLARALDHLGVDRVTLRAHLAVPREAS